MIVTSLYSKRSNTFKNVGMPGSHLNRFFISIVLPSILAIALYIVSIFVVILPSFESNSMELKKEMISELAHSVRSLLDEYYMEVQNGHFPEDSAKNLAARRVEKIRYGEEYKDYFWIIDETPEMIMHPYRPELIGSGLHDYQDPNGKRLFVEAVQLVEKDGEGFIDYMWQWKDDSTRIVPKLSYVMEFKPWGWIIGTGIYLEDVRQEIRMLKNRLLRIALLITLIISVILGFIIRQSLRIEHQRKRAEEKLRLSRQKYKTLVDASTEGTLMILHEEIIYANLKFSDLSGYTIGELPQISIGHLFEIEWESLIGGMVDPNKTVSRETNLHCRNGDRKEVVISVSMVTYEKQSGYIIVVKEMGTPQKMDKHMEWVTSELHASLSFMHQTVLSLVREIVRCSGSESIAGAASLMTRKGRRILFITQEERIVGVVSDGDLKRRALAESADHTRPVSDVMTSPVISIRQDALLFEAMLLMKEKHISHLAVKDGANQITGVVAYADFTDLRQNIPGFLVREIAATEQTDELVRLFGRLPVLAKLLTDSGSKIDHITRIISSVNDAIHQRVISLAIEESGPPPCRFAFMVMGSEGRLEQTLATDQDNAIVIEDLPGERGEEVRPYFLKLGEKINHALHAIGYNYCKGEIMAMNPRWTQSLLSWKKYFTDWIHTGNPHDILEASIFFDFRYVYGEESLIRELRDHVHSESDHQSVFFYHMAQAVLKYRSPLNIFGKIVGNDSEADALNLDIKKGLLPVIAFIRLYAIREKISETNSISRTEQLYAKKVISHTLYKEVLQAYRLMTRMRIETQVENMMQNDPPGNLIDLNQLSRLDITLLKTVLTGISELQTQVRFDFKGTE